jgi:signal transduction histidine kinase/CheY-like chemotaxis protein
MGGLLLPRRLVFVAAVFFAIALVALCIAANVLPDSSRAAVGDNRLFVCTAAAARGELPGRASIPGQDSSMILWSIILAAKFAHGAFVASDERRSGLARDAELIPFFQFVVQFLFYLFKLRGQTLALCMHEEDAGGLRVEFPLRTAAWFSFGLNTVVVFSLPGVTGPAVQIGFWGAIVSACLLCACALVTNDEGRSGLFGVAYLVLPLLFVSILVQGRATMHKLQSSTTYSLRYFVCGYLSGRILKYALNIGRWNNWLSGTRLEELLPIGEVLSILAGSLICDAVASKSYLEQAASGAVSAAAMGASRKAADSRQAVLRYLFHELRVPLNSILLTVDDSCEELAVVAAALSGSFDGQKSSETSSEDLLRRVRHVFSSLTSTTAAAVGLSRLCDEYLTLEKIDSGRFVIESRAMDLKQVLATTRHVFRAQYAAKSLTLATTVDDALPSRIVADPDRLRQCVANYLSNACKFSLPGGTVAVDVSLVYQERVPVSERAAPFPHGGHSTSTVVPVPHAPGSLTPFVRIAVKDAGVGISNEDQEKLFQPFQQISAGALQKGNGTGLGLSIVRMIAGLMGGRAGCTSAPGSGSEFFILLPLVEATDGIASLRSPSHSASMAVLDAPPEPVLTCAIIDDVETNRIFLSRLLKRNGVETVHLGSDGVDAVDLGRRLGNDIMLWLLDEEMPRKKGSEAIQELRAMGVSATIISVTGNALEEDQDKLLASGADGVCTKPVHLEVLKKLLLRHGLQLGPSVLPTG